MIIISESLDHYSNSILIRKFIGKVSAPEIIESWNDLEENNLINTELKGIINDLTTCDLNMDMESFKVVIKFIKKHPILRSLRHAVISDSPEIIVFPTMAEGREIDLKIKPFSTMESAKDWILSQY